MPRFNNLASEKSINIKINYKFELTNNLVVLCKD